MNLFAQPEFCEMGSWAYVGREGSVFSILPTAIVMIWQSPEQVDSSRRSKGEISLKTKGPTPDLAELHHTKTKKRLPGTDSP